MEGRRLTVGVVGFLIAALLAAGGVVLVLRPGGGQVAGSTGDSDGPAQPTIDPAAEVPVPGGTTGLAGRRSAGKGEVADRPWPSRVAAPGPWAATLAGRGDRVAFSVPGTVVGGTGRASLNLGAVDPRTPPSEGPATNRFLALPDRTRWYPLGRFRLDGPGDVAFSSATAQGRKVQLTVPTLEAVLGTAPGVTAVGSFVRSDGAKTDRLALPPGTTMGEECRDPPGDGPGSCPRGATPLAVEVDAAPALAVRASGDGEAAVAGSPGPAPSAAPGRGWWWPSKHSSFGRQPPTPTTSGP